MRSRARASRPGSWCCSVRLVPRCSRCARGRGLHRRRPHAASHRGTVDVTLRNLDAGGAPVPGEEVVLPGAYRFLRPRIVHESDLTRLVRGLLRELKRQVIANVSMTVSVDYDDTTIDGLNVVAISRLPSVVLSGPKVDENRFFSTNEPHEDVVPGSRVLSCCDIARRSRWTSRSPSPPLRPHRGAAEPDGGGCHVSQPQPLGRAAPRSRGRERRNRPLGDGPRRRLPHPARRPGRCPRLHLGLRCPGLRYRRGAPPRPGQGGAELGLDTEAITSREELHEVVPL